MRTAAALALAVALALGCGGTPALTVADAPAAPDAAADGDPAVDASEAPHPPCSAPARAAPAWYDTAVGYEIFVRSFADSDGDGVGDLKGLTARLDYLNDGDPATTTDLGVDVLWLMPINQSPSYHGYDVTDYRAVDDEYGTLADLDALLAAAHARGLRVVTDLVVNHSSSQHPWFLDAARGPASPRRDWYVWSDTFLDWDRPWGPGPVWHQRGSSWFYALFWDGMPDLNYANPAVAAEMTDIARFWLGRGVDGFRLDAARYLVETGPGPGQSDTPQTHAFWRDLRAALAPDHPDALYLGEVWTDTAVVATYFGAAGAPELTMSFDFDAAAATLTALQTGSASALAGALCQRLDGFPAHGRAASFLTNHDQVRVATELAGAGPDALRLAAALLLTLPGTPWLYYGEELGLKNGPGGGDEAKRLPMQWAAGQGVGFTAGTPWRAPASTAVLDSVAGQTGDPDSLLSHYRALIHLRRAHPALSVGATRRLEASGSAGPPLALLRELDDTRVVLAFNFAATPSTVTLAAADLPPATHFTALAGHVAQASRADTDAPLELLLPARGFAVLTP